MFGYDKLMNYYKTNFSMMQHHKYSLTEIEEMLPWERFIYIDMLKEHLNQLEEQHRDQMLAMKRR
jgi:hypothetical protein